MTHFGYEKMANNFQYISLKEDSDTQIKISLKLVWNNISFSFVAEFSIQDKFTTSTLRSKGAYIYSYTV